jgi:hypothetical protein
MRKKKSRKKRRRSNEAAIVELLSAFHSRLKRKKQLMRNIEKRTKKKQNLRAGRPANHPPLLWCLHGDNTSSWESPS